MMLTAMSTLMPFMGKLPDLAQHALLVLLGWLIETRTSVAGRAGSVMRGGESQVFKWRPAEKTVFADGIGHSGNIIVTLE